MSAMFGVFVCLAIVGGGCLALTLNYEPLKDIDDDAVDAIQLLNIMMKPRKPTVFHKVAEDEQGAYVQSFSWNDCGQSSDAAHVKSITISPDPLNLPGNVTVAFSWYTTDDITSPLALDIKLEKKIGFLWITVPCNRIPGTCHHVNICDELSKETCPTGYPNCHCPIKKGIYTMTPTTFSVPQGGVPSGDYRLTARLKQNGNEIGCVHLELAVD